MRMLVLVLVYRYMYDRRDDVADDVHVHVRTVFRETHIPTPPIFKHYIIIMFVFILQR